jgi:hypothetical protein
VTAPVLTLPEAFLLRGASLGSGPPVVLYLLINDRIDRDFQVIPNSTIEIAARASASVVKTQMRSVLYETFSFSRRNNCRFNLTYIDKDVSSSGSFGFRTDYMRALYRYGYDKAKRGGFWENAPSSDGLANFDAQSKKSMALQ